MFGKLLKLDYRVGCVFLISADVLIANTVYCPACQQHQWLHQSPDRNLTVATIVQTLFTITKIVKKYFRTFFLKSVFFANFSILYLLLSFYRPVHWLFHSCNQLRVKQCHFECDFDQLARSLVA